MTEESFMKLVCSQEVKRISHSKPLTEIVEGTGDWEGVFDLWVAANVRAFVDKLRAVASIEKVSSALKGVYEIDFYVGYGGHTAKFKLTTRRLYESHYQLKIVWFHQRDRIEWEQIGCTRGKDNNVGIETLPSHLSRRMLHGR